MNDNVRIAERLDEVARVLAEQGANPYRARAYHRAADTVRALDRPVVQLLESEGLDGLLALPGIGTSLARAIHQLATTGRLPMLDRLQGDLDPLAVLQSVPGIGAKSAARLHDRLGIHTLEELEVAAHDGRLQQALGWGPKRIAGLRDALGARLGRVRRLLAPASPGQPGVGELLDVDAEYRDKAARGLLQLIAPRRFNPAHRAWLPVLHATRGPRHYTALFSNTARAHELGRTGDWVVLYYDGPDGERQSTVVTAERGALRGLRIVRGREDECAAFHADHRDPGSAGSAVGARARGADAGATGGH